MALVWKFLPILISLIILGLIIWQIEPPKTITEITALQIFLLVIPLLTLMIFTANLCFNFYLRSLVISIGLILLIILKTLDKFNIITVGITLIATYLLAKSCKRRVDTILPTKTFKISKLQKQR